MKKIIPFAAASVMLLCSCENSAVLPAEPASHEAAAHQTIEEQTVYAKEPSDSTEAAPTPTYTQETESAEPASPVHDHLILPADTDFGYVMTEDDIFVQSILNAKKELVERCLIFYLNNMSAYREVSSPEELVINVTFPDDPSGKEYDYFLQSSEELPFVNMAELETCFHECFSEDVAEEYLEYMCGEGYNFFDYAPDVYRIPRVIERGGRLYQQDGYRVSDRSHNWDLIKVIDKTDEEIAFSFIDVVPLDPANVVASLGKLKYEDGEWKYAWDMTRDDWDCPPEYGGFQAIWGI